MRLVMRRFGRQLLQAVAVLGAAVALGLVGSPPSFAQGAGDLLVSPTRVVFEGRDRAETLSLSNRGSTTATFRISIVNMVMDDNGELREVDPIPADLKTAEALIQYAPRQVVIPPGGTQAVRLSLRKPANLPDGEYRSHIFFRAVPPESAGQSVSSAGPQDNSLEIRLIPIYGITIPAIVRHGTLDLKVGIGPIALEDVDGGKAAAFTLTRSGTRSSFGDIRIVYRRAAGGEPLVVGQITRLAVYTPNASRKVLVPLQLPDGVTLGAGTLEVSYTAAAEEGTAPGTPLASQTLRLP